MLNLNSYMLGTPNPAKLAAFYTKVLKKKPQMDEGEGKEKWFGWLVGKSYLSIGYHSKIKGKAKEPARVMMNFETKQVKSEFKRIKAAGAKVVKAPYTVGEGMWIATFADPDGNYFQLMTPWE